MSHIIRVYVVGISGSMNTSKILGENSTPEILVSKLKHMTIKF